MNLRFAREDVGYIAFALGVVALVVAISGCAGPSVDPAGLAAVTKENNASVGCATGTGPWGRAGVVYVNAEHASLASGKVTVNTDCSVTMEANAPGSAAPPTVPSK